MPVWVDLSEHLVSLNVYNSPAGKRLILRPLTPQSHIPPEIVRIGFEQRGEFYERRDLRFSLQDIQRLFPQATSREFPMSEIFYTPPLSQELVNLEQGMSTVSSIAGELGGSISPWEVSDDQTVGEWRYTNLTIGSTQIRVAVSQGGVVQINRDPFTKEGRELHVSRERILASVKAALPPVHASVSTVDAPTNWLERIMELPDDQIRELAKILGTPVYQHSHWRSFTEIDIHSHDDEKISNGFEQLTRSTSANSEAESMPSAVASRAPWHVTKEVFLGESRFESSGEHGMVLFDEVGYRTHEKTPAKAKAEVHERLVTEALYGRTAGPFPPSLPPFDVMLDYPSAIYRLNQRAEKNVSRLLAELGVGTKLIEGEDAYLKLHNPPYMDLVIERHAEPGGDRLYLTHYYRSNGDSCLDCEMVFTIRNNGTLRLVETATQDPFRGGELRSLDVSFANMFSKNLLDQKFGTARVMWPREERQSLDPHYFNGADELYEARLEEYMHKVLLKGEEFSTLVFAVNDEDGTIAGEKFISGSNKGSITKAQNALLAKYDNFSVLGYSTMFKYMLAKGVKTTFNLPVQTPEWLIEGQAYDVAIQHSDNPVRYWEGAIFKRMDRSFAGNGNGSEFVATFIHDRSSTVVSVPFDELEDWHAQELIKEPSQTEKLNIPDTPPGFNPLTPAGYAEVMADEALQLKYQDTLDSFFQERINSIIGESEQLGWQTTGTVGNKEINGKSYRFDIGYKQVGVGKNLVSAYIAVCGVEPIKKQNSPTVTSQFNDISRIEDDLTMAPEELAAKIDGAVSAFIANLVSTSTDPIDDSVKTRKVIAPDRQIKVYIDGFRQFLPLGKELDAAALMESIQPFISDEARSTDIPPFTLPDEAVIELDCGDVLRISAAGYTCEICATEPAPAFDDENKPWIRRNYESGAPKSFVSALATTTKWLKENLSWEAKKTSYPDGGHQLDELANQYATFLHDKMPSHHDGRVNEMHRSFAIAIMDKEVDYLLDWIGRARGSNDNSKKYFTQATGCKLPSTIRDITTAVYTWAGFTPEQAAQQQKDKEAAREVRLQARRIDDDIKWHGNSLSNSNVNHDGEIKTTKQFLDDIIGKGYTQIGTHQSGAVVRYRLENPDIQRSYSIKGKMVDYARAVLAKRAEQKLELEVPEEELRPALRP